MLFITKVENFLKVHTTICSTTAVTVTIDYLLTFLLCFYPMTEALLSHAAPVSREAFLSTIQSSIFQLKENYTHHDQNRIRESKKHYRSSTLSFA